MAAKNKNPSKLSKYKVVLCGIALVTVSLAAYFWFIYGRLLDRQKSTKSSAWEWFSLIPKDNESITTDLILNIIQEDLYTVYIQIIQIICLLIPRETTSILSAVVLISAAVVTYSVHRSRKNTTKDKGKQKKYKKLENETRYFNIFAIISTISSNTVSLVTLRFLRGKREAVEKNENQGLQAESSFGGVGRGYQQPKSVIQTFTKIMLTLIILAFLASIPWEYVRLFQIEVAKRMALLEKGVPKECYPDQMTITQSIRYWLLLQLSWQHDPCEKYHKALLVDPLWEITPLMVLTSVITRSILHPIELFFSGMGKSFKVFFNEIPAQWQPVMLIVLTVVTILIVAMIRGYRVSLPFLLKIEPKTPLSSFRRAFRHYQDQKCNEQLSSEHVAEKKQLDYHG